jgi:flagellar hook-length control protein FliK
MTRIDITALAAAPAPDALASADAPGAPAEVSSCVFDAFAALLDEVAGECDKGNAQARDQEDCFDELAALAMTSLLNIGVPVPSTPAADPASGRAVAATQKVDQAVVTDLSFVTRDAVVDVGTSSLPPTTTIGNDMGLDESLELVKTDAATAPAVEATATTQTPKTPKTTGESTPTEQHTTPDAVATTPAAKGVDATTLVHVVAAADVDPTTRETLASTMKVDADVTPAAKAARSPTFSRLERSPAAPDSDELDLRARQGASSPPAAQKTEEVRTTTGVQPAAIERPFGSTAARLARALERAAAPTTSEGSNTVPAASANTGSGSGQPSAFGDAASSRAAQLTAAMRPHLPSGVAFVNAPAPIDARTLVAAVADATGPAVDTAPMTIPERDVIARLVQSMRVQFRDGIGEAVVKLKPEHLGSVQISLRVENGAIRAAVHAEAPAVRQWLESQQETLRSGLAEQGLRLERFVVEPDGESRHTTADRHHQQEREERRRQHRRRMSEKDAPVFEVTV